MSQPHCAHLKRSVNGKSIAGKDKIKFLLVEGVHPSALENLQRASYTNMSIIRIPLETLKHAIRDAHSVGIRSRTI
ncbi:MAG: hypothetical protein GPOALKHO_001894 [Sodalis sp.]|nr:MAG: hypothetical protein GPOALKHO_001894 [Sodalis sp.]